MIKVVNLFSYIYNFVPGCGGWAWSFKKGSCQSLHYKNTPIQIYTENFTTKKWKFSDKNSDIFHTSAQNIDCGYSLEPPQRGGSNEYPQSFFEQKQEK